MTRPTPRTAAHEVSRRGALGILGGTAGVAATTMLTPPSWAVDDARPGSVRDPQLTARDRVVVSRVSAERAVEHILELSEGIGPRIGGTPSERAAAEYLAGVLDGYGYDVVLEEFPVADKFLAQVDGDPVLDQAICWQMGAAPLGALDVTVTGPAVRAADTGADLTGAVALVETPAGVTVAARTLLVQAAAGRGAAAVVVLPADAADPIRRTQASSPALSTSVGVPVVGAAQVQKARLLAAVAAGPLSLTVATTAYRGLTSQNVLASRSGRGAPPAQGALMVCGHYDSVIGAPGANDDGSGTALTVEVARVMRSLPTQREIRFSLWGSEEQGLIGSRLPRGPARPGRAGRAGRRLQQRHGGDELGPGDPVLGAVVGRVDERHQLLGHRRGRAPRVLAVAVAGDDARRERPPVLPGARRRELELLLAGRGVAGAARAAVPLPEDTVATNISLERLQVSLELISAAFYDVAGGA